MKLCPYRFREFAENAAQECIGENCAKFEKCQGNGTDVKRFVSFPMRDGHKYAKLMGRQFDQVILDELHFDGEHESYGQDADQGERDNVGGCESDTRAKLEADMRDILQNAYMYAWMHGHQDRRGCSFVKSHYREFDHLLDRQAAITEREWERASDVVKAERDELQAKVDELTAECAECVYKQEFDRLDELERERDYWKLHTDCWADKYKQRNEEANEYANKLEELERENAELVDKLNDVHDFNAKLQRENARHPFANVILSSLDSRENELKLQEKVDELERENAKLSSDELHWHAEADRYRSMYERMAKAVDDVARNYTVVDEGMA